MTGTALGHMAATTGPPTGDGRGPMSVLEPGNASHAPGSAASTNRSTSSTSATVLAPADTSPSRLYRGIMSPLMMEAPKRAVKFGANGWWGALFTNNGQKKMTQSLSILTGCCAGATESFIVTPFELVKIRLQDKASAHLYKGPLDVVKQVVAKNGILG